MNSTTALNGSQAGDRKNRVRGAERLVSEYGNLLYAAAVLLCSNDQDAEDLTFRTLDRAIKKIHQRDPKRNFFTWLYAILLNFRRMDLRRKRTRVIPVGGTEDLPEVACDSFADTLCKSDDDSLTRAVRSLSAPLREAVVLRYYGGKSVEEIARIADVPVGTVKSRLHNAREALNGFLRKERGIV